MSKSAFSLSGQDYTSFLLRLWRDAEPEASGRAGEEAWVVEVEHIPTGEKRYFTSIDACFAYIRDQIHDRPSEERG